MSKVKAPESNSHNLRLEWRSADELAENPANWRSHPPAQVKALKGVLADVGWAGALLYNSQTNRLIDGHLRKEVFKGQQVPVLVGSWTEAQEREILATYDPLSAMAQPDTDALIALLAQVETGSEDVKALLEALANGENLPLLAPKEGLTPDDEVPEVPEPICKMGQLWQLGEHRLLCGDSTKREDVEKLMAGEKAKLMLTDPPYGVNYETSGENPNAILDSRPIANDNLGKNQGLFWQTAFGMWPLNGDAYIFSPSGPPIAALALSIQAAGIEHHQWLIWAKQQFALGRSHYHYRHEHIFYGWKVKTSWNGSRTEDSVWECDRPFKSPEHPTMKPVALCERAIRNSSSGAAIVVDPFGGSGSTLIACEKLGRKCRMMEIEPHYCDVIIKRWEGFTGQKAELLEYVHASP